MDDVQYGSSIIQQNGHRWRFMTLTTSPESDQNKVSTYFARFRATLAKHGYRPQYFKVTERTKAGRKHFHLIVDVFVPFNVIQAAWRAATDGTATWVNIKKAQVKRAAGYLTKYMTKQTIFTEDRAPHERLYSFSQHFPRLPKPEPTGEWEFILKPKHGGQIAQARVELTRRISNKAAWVRACAGDPADLPGDPT